MLLSTAQAVFASRGRCSVRRRQCERRALEAFGERISKRVAHELRAYPHVELDQNWQRDFDLTSRARPMRSSSYYNLLLLLSLHGALILKSHDDGEGFILSRLRKKA